MLWAEMNKMSRKRLNFQEKANILEESISIKTRFVKNLEFPKHVYTFSILTIWLKTNQLEASKNLFWKVKTDELEDCRFLIFIKVCNVFTLLVLRTKNIPYILYLNHIAFYILSETRMLRNDYFMFFFKTVLCKSASKASYWINQWLMVFTDVC